MNPAKAATLIATVGGLGRVSFAPGTWGSLVGLGLGLLGTHGVPWLRSPAVLLGAFALCALACSLAEEALRRHDPPSVILDEVWGMWAVLAVIPWATWVVPRLLLAFLLFRLFDIAKPAPLKALARLPAGWGIMADDLGAAVYAGAVLEVARWLSGH